VLTDIAVDQLGNAYFCGADRRLYAVADRAIAIWGLALDAFVTSGPIVMPNSDVVFGTERADLRVVRRGRPFHVSPLPAAVTAPIVARPDGSLFALAGATLYALGADYEPRWTFAPARAFAISDSGVVAVEGGDLVWLDADGGVQQRWAAGEELGTSLALDAAGRAYAVTRDGGLRVIEPEGGASRQVELGSRRVQFLVFDAPRRRLLAASGDGWVFAVDAPRISAPASAGGRK
jgi:hypothetical protein